MAGSNTDPDNTKQIHDFLIEEYKYAGEYAMNILRDRTVTINLYVVILAALSYAIVQLYVAQNPTTNINLIIAILLLFYSLVNWLNFAHFVSLQVTYQDSISRMNDIRQYYKQLTSDAILTGIFSVEDKEFISPTKLRPTNSAMCTWYTILTLASLLLTGIYFDRYWSSYWPLTIAVVVALLLAGFNYYYYQKRGWGFR